MRWQTPIAIAWFASFPLVALTGCGTVQKPVPVLTTVCLASKTYSPAEQKQAASELAALPQGSVIAQMVIDYGAMRSANRAACAQPAR